MLKPRFALGVLVLVGSVFVATTACAYTLGGPLIPDHDWTVSGYGLQEFQGSSYVVLSSHSIRIPLPLYVVAGLLLISFVGPFVTASWLLRRRSF
ncbi:MAG TPA: hypothetical protein VLT36_10365 [Candidatus Dormibacteraeota bacterium]|nr:hypothetical protein [Candidatus Dormibacteraeota bacterium]